MARTTPSGRVYGWRRDLPDPRDHVFAAPPAILHSLPPHFTLRPELPAVYEQSQLGACTTNALSSADRFCMMLEDPAKAFDPSRLAWYYDERALEGTTASDSGAAIRDGIKVISRGVGPETLWPYDISKFADQPPPAYYAEAAKHPAIAYARVLQQVNQIKGSIAARRPPVIGFTVFESFESGAVDATGDIPMPSSGEGVLGGHAVQLAGWDDGSRRFLFKNSYGVGWGSGGYGTLPYDYLVDPNLSSDFWALWRVRE